MNYKQRLFIYERREMITLLLLLFMISLFAFTLGVHFGKRVGSKLNGLAGLSELEDPVISPVTMVPDQLPNRQEFLEQSKGAKQAVEETLNDALHQEVVHTGIKLDRPRQVDLPVQTKSLLAGATTLKSSALSKMSQLQYTLQIGSYPSLEEAKKQMALLKLWKLKPFLRETTIAGKGKWYRIYVGEFRTQDAAEQTGEQYRVQHIIASFVVSQLSGSALDLK